MSASSPNRLGLESPLARGRWPVSDEREPGMRQPNWRSLWLLAVAASVLGLGLLKLLGLPWVAIAGGAIGLGTFLPLLIRSQKKGYEEWAEEDRSLSARPSTGASECNGAHASTAENVRAPIHG